MNKTKEWIIANKGLEYYETKKAYQREYEKQHRAERNQYKKNKRTERKAEHKKKPILAYHNENDYFKIWFSSTADAAELLTGDRKKGTTITAVIHNKLKTFKKLKFRYV